MINHARTLLLNSRSVGDPAPWERYLPEEFQALLLPSYLERIRKLLVGTGGWWDRTYRIECMLTMLDSKRYEGTFSWMDARTTPPQTTPFMYSEPGVSVSRVAAVTPDPYITYLNIPFSGELPIKRTWQLLGSGTERVTAKFNDGGADIFMYYDPAHAGYILPLAPDIQLLFSGYGAVNDIWNVRAYKKPVNVFASFPPLVSALPIEWTQQLFYVAQPSEDSINTYARWYKTCVHAEDKVVAVVLSYLLKCTMMLG